MLARWLKINQPSDLIGLDIDSNTVKLLKINQYASPFKVEFFETAELPADTVVKGEIKNHQVAAQTIKNHLKKSGFVNKNIALAIPRSSTITKNITIDSRLSEEDIESRVWIEARNQFPELVGEIYIDFSILGPSADDPNQLDLMLVACRKDVLKPYLEVLNLAGATPKIVDVNNYALERALSVILKRTPEVKTAALLNLDSGSSTLIVIHENKLIYSQDETFDGLRLMKQIRELPKDVPNYIETIKEKLSAHIRHTMHFFYSSRPNINIEKLYLSGDCALLDNVATVIQQETGLDTQIADPFSGMTMSRSVDEKELKKQEPAMMLCFGLALSSAK